MAIELPPLPYAYNALEPWISVNTLRWHHDVLQARYVHTVNELAPDATSLEALITTAPPGKLLESASQVWNHTFLWSSMVPPDSFVRRFHYPLLSKIESTWSTWHAFVQDVVKAATSLFGSGYVWLLSDPRGELELWSAQNAANPLRYKSGSLPLLTIDVWEHAYYLDYMAERGQYVSNFLTHLANWDFAEANYLRSRL